MASIPAKGEDYDQVSGLDCGADDYVIKPFTLMVLAARMEALFRRSDKEGCQRTVFDGMRIDTSSRKVLAEGERLTLSPKETICLNTSRTSNTVDTHINRLRNKLGRCGGYISTMRGYGYKFEVKS